MPVAEVMTRLGESAGIRTVGASSPARELSPHNSKLRMSGGIQEKCGFIFRAGPDYFLTGDSGVGVR